MGETKAGDAETAKGQGREDGLRGVLLVEPDESVRRALARGLEQRGFAVLQAADEELAREHLASGDFRVVATAAELGPGPGFEWLTRLAGLWPGGAVCALAGDRRDAKMLRHGLQA